MTVLSFAGIEFHGDAEGKWGLSRMPGWYDGAPPKVDIRERANANGANEVDQFYRAARPITVMGSFRGNTDTEAFIARQQLSVIQAVGTSSPFVVSDPLGVRSAEVTLVRAPISDDHILNGVFKFSFDVVATDPRRYGPAEVVSTGLRTSGGGIAWPIVWPADWGTPGNPGRLTVTNPGDDETSTVYAVTGGLTAGFEFNHVENGDLIRFERLVPEGGTVFIDMETGTAWLDDPSNDVTWALTRRGFWSVPAQSSHQVAFRSLGGFTGTPTLTATTRPAY